MTDEAPNIETIEVYRGSFAWALKKLQQGKRVRRKAWGAGVDLQYYAPDVVVLRSARSASRLANVIEWEDVLAFDWMAVV